MNGKALGLMIGLSLASTVQAAEEIRTTLDEQTQVAVTIYNNDLALVKDQRLVKLNQGDNDLAFADVSAQIRPETALMSSVSHGDGFFLREQNFDFDLLTPESLLKKYVGRQVRIVRSHPTTGDETEETATVLATNSGVVLKIGNRIETSPPGRIVFDDIPDNLRERPTLVMKLHSATAEPQKLELSYLTGGLSWQADYVAELSNDEKTLALNGWVTLTNNSGTAYPNALLQLVAGDVNQVSGAMTQRKFRSDVMLAEAAAPQMEEEALFEYHLYTLSEPTTIANQQTKQVALLSASNVPAAKEYLLAGQNWYYQSPTGGPAQKLKVGVYLEFINTPESNLGMPLPKGVMRIYKRDSQERAQFVGEDNVDHTPKNESVRLKLGDAFDITAERTQTDFQKRSGFGRYNYEFESAYRIELNNAKDEAVTVKVREPIPGDWEMVQESHAHRKIASDTAEWSVDVPANGKARLEYRVRSRF